MSLLDILLICIIGGSVVLGFMTGIAKVGIGFVATICGLLFGFWFYQTPAAWFHSFISSVTVSNVLGFLVVFLVLELLGAIIAKIVSKILRWTGLSFFDRLLGAAFGFVRGSLIGVGFVAILMAFSPRPIPNWMVNSMLLPYAVDASNILAAMAPKALTDGFHTALAEIRKDWDEQVKKSLRKKKSNGNKSEDDKEDR
jgi:membrane protein required for colicin V production